jgi:hypothetical protein
VKPMKKRLLSWVLAYLADESSAVFCSDHHLIKDDKKCDFLAGAV